MWVGRCLPYGEGGPYAPLRDLLLRAAAVRADASREEIRARVTGQLQAILPEGSDEQIAELLRFVGGERMLPADATTTSRATAAATRGATCSCGWPRGSRRCSSSRTRTGPSRRCSS